MNWQLIVVISLVSAAGYYLAHSAWRSWRGAGKGCGGHCKCDKPKEEGPRLISVESLVLRSPPAKKRGASF
jgi:hypothetical protein